MKSEYVYKNFYLRGICFEKLLLFLSAVRRLSAAKSKGINQNGDRTKSPITHIIIMLGGRKIFISADEENKYAEL